MLLCGDVVVWSAGKRNVGAGVNQKALVEGCVGLHLATLPHCVRLGPYVQEQVCNDKPPSYNTTALSTFKTHPETTSWSDWGHKKHGPKMDRDPEKPSVASLFTTKNPPAISCSPQKGCWPLGGHHNALMRLAPGRQMRANVSKVVLSANATQHKAMQCNAMQCSGTFRR